jgi:4'-phosphopantetheinyl transferase
LWYVEFADVPEERLARYAALLDAEETARRARFRFERDGRAYAVSHALLRAALSHYAAIEPAAWRFVAGVHGRPEIAAPADHGGLRFNLSHTRGAALVGICRDAEIGVDLEAVERNADCAALARRYFASDEVRDLERLPREQRRAGFFEYWTLKEAYVKARGLGLSVPLDQFAFHLDAAEIAVSFDRRLGDDPQAWQFRKWRPGAAFQAAAAVRRAATSPMQFVLRRAVPLGEVGPPQPLSDAV